MSDPVYFITDGQGLVKIGRSVNPQKRLKELQTGNPHELFLIGICEDRCEQYYHGNYSDYRVRNNSEWFHIRGALADHLWNEYDYISPHLPAFVTLDFKEAVKHQFILVEDDGEWMRIASLSFMDGSVTGISRMPSERQIGEVYFDSVHKMREALERHFEKNGLSAPFRNEV